MLVHGQSRLYAFVMGTGGCVEEMRWDEREEPCN